MGRFATVLTEICHSDDTLQLIDATTIVFSFQKTNQKILSIGQPKGHNLRL